jgi:hypothetical protein
MRHVHLIFYNALMDFDFELVCNTSHLSQKEKSGLEATLLVLSQWLYASPHLAPSRYIS